jgi:hypothetical protein
MARGRMANPSLVSESFFYPAAIMLSTQLEGINIIQTGCYLGFSGSTTQVLQPIVETLHTPVGRDEKGSRYVSQLDRAEHTFSYADTLCFTFLAAATCNRSIPKLASDYLLESGSPSRWRPGGRQHELMNYTYRGTSYHGLDSETDACIYASATAADTTPAAAA